MDTIARNADLPTIVDMLKRQRAQRHDMVVPARNLRAEGGQLFVATDAPHHPMDLESGVGDPRPVGYDPTDVMEEGLAAKLGIHRAYLRRLRTANVPLWDANVNGWLEHDEQAGKRYLFRALRDNGTGEGIGRALLSERYGFTESLDVVMATLEGIAEAGVQVDVDRADLTDRRLYVTMHSPDVAALAPKLLDGYRSPWAQPSLAAQRIDRNSVGDMLQLADQEGMGYDPGTEPVVWAGFELRNSDVGCGAWSLSPKLMVKVCRNGLTMDLAKLRKVHLGGRLEEGQVKWSQETQEADLALIKRQTVDAIGAFLSEDFLTQAIATLEEQAGVEVPVDEAPETVKVVAKGLHYSDDRADALLAHFMAGGQFTAGGVMQAVTSVAQTVANGDDAAQMEADGVRALELAARHAS